MSGADFFSGRVLCAKGAQKLHFLCATSQGPFPSLALGLEDGWIIEGKVRAFTEPEGLIEQGQDPQRKHPSSCSRCAQSVFPCPWCWGDLLATLTGSCSLHTFPSSRELFLHMPGFCPPPPPTSTSKLGSSAASRPTLGAWARASEKVQRTHMWS